MDTTPIISQFAAYPRKRKLDFHCGLIKLPFWVEEGPEPFRPTIAICACPQTTSLNASDIVAAEQSTLASLLQAIAGTGKITMNPRVRPGRILLTDQEIAQYLTQALRDTGVEIEVIDEDPIIAQFAAGLSTTMPGGPNGKMPPGALSGKDMTLERFAAFADAARRFYAAAPWRHLTSDDLIVVEAPKAPSGLGFCTVLGNGETAFGLGFFKSRKQFIAALGTEDHFQYMSDQGKLWSLLYGPISEIPVDDADQFEEHGLPIAADNAYPFLIRTDVKRGEISRPGAAEMAFVEGLARVLAETTEEEMDAGRWTRTVPTADGDMTYTLSLPGVLEEASPRVLEELFGMDFEQVPPEDALAEAERLVEIARVSSGRKQLQLARKAIEISPDCADAYTLLATRAIDEQTECELYHKALEAGQRALGDAFEQMAGHFWLMLETRPYMRARMALANCLRRTGKLEDAANHYREMLRLNPNDNQGARELLGTLLYELGHFTEVEDLLNRYPDDDAHWLHLRTLLSFRQFGDHEQSRADAAAALRRNKHARLYLIGERPLPEELPMMYEIGSEEEAILMASNQIAIWADTPGALEWLTTQRQPRTPTKKKSTKRKPK